MAKQRVAVIHGGRSREHEVSIVSARNVMAALDPQATLADIRLPQRGLFAAVQVRMERPHVRGAVSLRALALQTAGHDLETLERGFGGCDAHDVHWRS